MFILIAIYLKQKAVAKRLIYCIVISVSGYQAVVQWDDRCISDFSKVRKEKQRYRQMVNEWEKTDGPTKTQTEAQRAWRRVIKKRCCLAEEDITSDTNVKLASSGTIRALFCSSGSVEGVCVAVSCSFYTPELHHASTILLFATPFSLWHPSHPPSCTVHQAFSPHCQASHPSLLSVHANNWKCVVISVFFPCCCQSYGFTSQTFLLTFIPPFFQHHM